MPTVKELRAALAAAVGTIDGVRGYDHVRAAANPGDAHVWRKGPLVYDEVQHAAGEEAADTFLFAVRVHGSFTNEKVGQDFLDEIAEPVGDRSLKVAVETDDNLGALCDWALVTEVGDLQVVGDTATTAYLSLDFTVEIAVS